MDNTPRRRPRSTGPSRSAGPGLRVGRSASGRSSSRLSTTLIDPGAPGAAADPAAASRPTGRRARPAGPRPAVTRPASAPSPTSRRRIGRVSPAAGTGRPVTPMAKSRLALHVAVLGLVFCAVAFVLAVPLRNYFSQRNQLAAAVATEQQMRQQKLLLEQQQAALADPAYVEAQAKARLQYVKPGETVYVVHAPELPKAATPGPTAPVVQAPWYSNLWDTLADPAAAKAGG